MSITPVVELVNISKSFGANHVLRDTSLSVAAKEVIAAAGRGRFLRCARPGPATPRYNSVLDKTGSR